jgi:hypothetical protein
VKRNDFADEDLDGIILGPDDEPPNKPEKARGQTRRLARSNEFARIWLSWLKEPRWCQLLPPAARLWLVVWYRCGEGGEPIQLTQKIAEEANVAREICYRYARKLEKLGLVRVQRRGKSALILTVQVRPPPPRTGP